MGERRWYHESIQAIRKRFHGVLVGLGSGGALRHADKLVIMALERAQECGHLGAVNVSGGQQSRTCAHQAAVPVRYVSTECAYCC